ncbi:MAG: methyltransferase domain-containing protein [Candidatus ainarchaeum sp.]|nr:methyltransferase domain-containing protein [Candidatus ainarchaeum sp.]
MLVELILGLAGLTGLAFFFNWLDYRFMKDRYLKSEKFDLNICCGGCVCDGINADVVERNVPRFVLLKDIYKLPFGDKQFKNTICSHALEHVEDPVRFFKELQRVSENVVILVPPLWDYGCMFNIPEHRWQFLTLKSRHVNKLPGFFELPLSDFYQRTFGQKI